MSVFVAAVALKQWKLSVLSSRRSKQRGTSVLQEAQRSEEGALLKRLTRLKRAGFGVPPDLWKKRDTSASLGFEQTSPNLKPPAAGTGASARAVFPPLVAHTSCMGIWAVTPSNAKADAHFSSPLRLIQIFIPEEGSCLSCCRFTWLMAEGSGKSVGEKGTLNRFLHEGMAKKQSGKHQAVRY